MYIIIYIYIYYYVDNYMIYINILYLQKIYHMNYIYAVISSYIEV